LVAQAVSPALPTLGDFWHELRGAGVHSAPRILAAILSWEAVSEELAARGEEVDSFIFP
jgi:hypothetical protein